MDQSHSNNLLLNETANFVNFRLKSPLQFMYSLLSAPYNGSIVVGLGRTLLVVLLLIVNAF